LIIISQFHRGVLRVNLSYLKGKKHTWELTSQGAWIQIGAEEQSHAMRNWSSLTSDDERDMETNG